MSAFALLLGSLMLMCGASVVALVIGLTEEKAARSGRRDPDYRLAIQVVRLFAWACFPIWAVVVTNYTYRALTGFAGQPGVGGTIGGTLFSLVSGFLCLMLFTAIGLTLAYLVNVAYDPDPEEMAKQNRMLEERARWESESVRGRGGDR